MSDKNPEGPETLPQRRVPNNLIPLMVAVSAVIGCILTIEPVDLKRGLYQVINGTTKDGKVIVKELGPNSFVVIDKNGQEYAQEVVASSNP